MSTKNSTELSWMIGGAQGSGVDSSANIFARACANAGQSVFGTREYYSNIKGLHSYFEVRVSDKPRHSKIDNVDLLATFDAETLIRHSDIVDQGGAIIYDPLLSQTEIKNVRSIEDEVIQKIRVRLETQGLKADLGGLVEEASRRGIKLYPIPYEEIISQTAHKFNESQLSKFSKIVNVLAVTASLALIGLDEYLDKAISDTFAQKRKVVEMNLAGAGFVREYMEREFKTRFGKSLRPVKQEPKLLLMGNEAVALGKIVGGGRFQSYYPITPASDESEFLESHDIFDLLDKKKGSIVVVQTEDEIAAITMAIGAALTGARASTSTSGPGFSLMVEGLGWAGMNEVPVVITLYSRGGPSTGMPTRNEQGDLKFALNAGHGDFPRIVLCSGDMEECFFDAIRAFNYAERYQTPTIHLMDKAIANCSTTVSDLGMKSVIERGKLIGLYGFKNPPKESYKRFAFTEDGISPRAVLGLQGHRFWNTGDEHSEFGHISEDPGNRVKMMKKRMQKIDLAEREIPDTEKVNFFPSKKSAADVTIVSWGSPKGAILDAMELLSLNNIDCEFIQIRMASPFPTSFMKSKLERAKLIVGIEQNYSGQMASVVEDKTHIEIGNRVLKFNGRPISQDEVYDSIKSIAKNPIENKQVILVHGA